MKMPLLGVAAVLGAPVATSLFTARPIEAQYSSPVKVVNTMSALAINSNMDDRGRVAYQSTKSCNGGAVCEVDFGPVPSGYRLVIQEVGGKLIHNGLGPQGTTIQFAIGDSSDGMRGCEPDFHHTGHRSLGLFIAAFTYFDSHSEWNIW